MEPDNMLSKLFDNSEIVSDLRNFLSYLMSLWGLLSAFSAFFPLVNRFRDVVPSRPKTSERAVRDHISKDFERSVLSNF